MISLPKNVKPTTIAIYSLGIILGFIHVFVGISSFGSFISDDYHRDMKIQYNTFARNLVFLHDFVDKASLALYMRYSFAAFQIIFGAFLAENGYFGTSHSRFGNVGLVVVDSLMLILQLLSKAAYERMAPTLVFNILLAGRYFMVQQGTKRVKVGVKTRNAGKVKSSTPKKNKNE